MRTFFLAVLVSACTLWGAADALAQTPNYQRPNPEIVEQAKTIAADSVFTRLEAGKADELAEWVTDQVHSEASGTSRMQQLSQFQSQFRMIAQGPPQSPFGEMIGYDLLQESHLPGTNRYFRLTYMSYHQQAPLVWEMHFYVKPDDTPAMTYIQFNGQNPFAYMTTPDMLIENYYDSY